MNCGGNARMKTFTIDEARDDLDALLEHARQGGTVIIADADQAYKLVTTIVPKKGPRKAGLFKGKIKITDEFFEPMPEFEPYS